MRATPLRRIAVVGGGLAAARAVERLAERGFAGRVDVIGDEPHRPYRRPALSDGVLSGHASRRSLRIDVPEPRLTRWLTGRKVLAVDRPAARLELDDGRTLPFDGLIAATGVRPRQLAVPESIDPRLVHTIRTIEDAWRLRVASRSLRRVLVSGGGLVGSEAACSLQSRGVRVTLVETAATLLAQPCGPVLGDALTRLHRRRGVDVRTSTGLAELSAHRDGLAATLTDATVVRADAVVVAVGSAPTVDWLAGSGLDTTDGLLCDPWLFAVGDDGDTIVGAGDCARWRNARFDGRAGRVEQWVTTTLMARHAVDSLLDGRASARPFTPIPWGWTEQWGVRIQLVGSPRAVTEQRTFDGDPGALRGSVSFHDAAGRLVGGVSAERPGASLQLTSLLAAAWPEPPGGDAVWEDTNPAQVSAAAHQLAPDRRAHARSEPHAPSAAPSSR